MNYYFYVILLHCYHSNDLSSKNNVDIVNIRYNAFKIKD